MSRAKRSGVNYTVLGLGLLLVIPLLVLFARSFGNNPREVPSVLVGTPAPDFTLVDLDGTTWTLDELQGKPVVLNFWSTWCGPCKIEHPLLQAAARANPDVVFLGVIYGDDPDACRRYLAREGTAYDHLIDPQGRTAIDYGVAGVPETYFIRPDGSIAYKHPGALTGSLIREQFAAMGVL